MFTKRKLNFKYPGNVFILISRILKMIFIISFSVVKIISATMNLLGTSVNYCWEKIIIKSIKYSDIGIENTVYAEGKDRLLIASQSSSKQCLSPNPTTLQPSCDANLFPVLNIKTHFHSMMPKNLNKIPNLLENTGEIFIPSKEYYLKNKSPNKNLSCCHRTTSAVRMKNHPLRKSTNNFQTNSNTELRNDVINTISRKNYSLLNLNNSNKVIENSKEINSNLRVCENTNGINADFKNRMILSNTNDLKNGDFDSEVLGDKDSSPIKIAKEGEVMESKDNISGLNRTNPVPFLIEDYHADETSYLEDLIRKINSISKSKKILSLINDELVLSERVLSSRNKYYRSNDNTWITFHSSGKATTSVVSDFEANVANSKSKFISKNRQMTLSKPIIDKYITQNRIINHQLENAGIKKNDLLSKSDLNLRIVKDRTEFQDRPTIQLQKVPANKNYNTIIDEENITPFGDNLTLNLNHYDIHRYSDVWLLKEHSDIKSISNQNSRLSETNFELKAHKCYDDIVVKNRQMDHVIIGCCSECRPKPYSYKNFIYNIQQEENKDVNTHIIEKNIEEEFQKYKSHVLETQRKKIEEAENIFVSNPLNEKTLHSENSREDHFSRVSDSTDSGLHKNVFKKFNPRSLFPFQAPTLRKCIKSWEGAKKIAKSSEILKGNESIEFLTKKRSEELMKEAHDDESPLILYENKSCENLVSDSFCKYSTSSTSMEWHKGCEIPFQTESSNSCGSEDCQDTVEKTQLIKTRKNESSKFSVLRRRSESFINFWSNYRKKTETKSLQRTCVTNLKTLN